MVDARTVGVSIGAAGRVMRAPGVGPILVLVPFVVLLALKPILPAEGIVWPMAIAVPFIDWINVVVDVFHKHEILGVFTVKDATRAIARVIEWPLDIMHGLLAGGFKSIGIPAIPWVMIAGLAAVFGWWLKGLAARTACRRLHRLLRHLWQMVAFDDDALCHPGRGADCGCRRRRPGRGGGEIAALRGGCSGRSSTSCSRYRISPI